MPPKKKAVTPAAPVSSLPAPDVIAKAVRKSKSVLCALIDPMYCDVDYAGLLNKYNQYMKRREKRIALEEDKKEKEQVAHKVIKEGKKQVEAIAEVKEAKSRKRKPTEAAAAAATSKAVTVVGEKKQKTGEVKDVFAIHQPLFKLLMNNLRQCDRDTQKEVIGLSTTIAAQCGLANYDSEHVCKLLSSLMDPSFARKSPLEPLHILVGVLGGILQPRTSAAAPAPSYGGSKWIVATSV